MANTTQTGINTARHDRNDPRTGASLRLLLSDGSGLTARQVATQAHALGHTVEVLSPTQLGLVGLTRHVRRLHRVPRFGEDPFGWLEAALAVLAGRRYDVLLATHEQAALLSR